VIVICKSEVSYVSYQIWHTHPLVPNPLSQVDILVFYAIVSNWLSLKHIIAHWDPLHLIVIHFVDSLE
jgi:hypothetical protein